jgi:hypothetical protein
MVRLRGAHWLSMAVWCAALAVPAQATTLEAPAPAWLGGVAVVQTWLGHLWTSMVQPPSPAMTLKDGGASTADSSTNLKQHVDNPGQTAMP